MVSVDRGGEIEFARAYGLAHRAHQIPNTTDTRFAIASGTKGLTALAVVSLIERWRAAPVHDRAVGARRDLPLIGDDVTVEHLLAHRSGIGDYLDEEAGHEITEYVLTVPAQDLATTEQYLAVLGGHPAKFAPGERFSYCNGGYVVLALIAERVSGVPFPELVRQRVAFPRACATPSSCGPTSCPAAPRPATCPSRACRGRTCSTCRSAAAGTAGSTPPSRTSAPSGRPCSPANRVRRLGSRDAPPPQRRARRVDALRARLLAAHATSTVILDGLDAGVSFRTVHDPGSAITHTVISNSSDGAWPVGRLDELLGGWNPAQPWPVA